MRNRIYHSLEDCPFTKLWGLLAPRNLDGGHPRIAPCEGQRLRHLLVKWARNRQRVRLIIGVLTSAGISNSFDEGTGQPSLRMSRTHEHPRHRAALDAPIVLGDDPELSKD